MTRTSFLFDLDGILVDSAYQHVLAWRDALERAGVALSVWRIRRRIGMSGGLLVNALLRETGHRITREEASFKLSGGVLHARLPVQKVLDSQLSRSTASNIECN